MPNPTYGHDIISVIHSFEYNEEFKVYRDFNIAPMNAKLLVLANGKQILVYSLTWNNTKQEYIIKEEYKAMKIAFNANETHMIVLFEGGIIKLYSLQ